MNIFSKIAELQSCNQAFVLVTVIDSSGSVPGKIGFKMIVESDGSITGTVGGGEIEFEAIKRAKIILQEGVPKTEKYVLAKDHVDVKDDETLLSMRCNGKVTLFYEPFGNLPKVFVFGGGHVAQALCSIIPRLGYYTTVIENREEYASVDKCPGANKYIFSEYQKFCEKTDFSENDFIVILTFGHSHDYEIIRSIFSKSIRPNYIGAIASKAKASGFRKQLKTDFGEDVNIDSLYSPIGLEIGGATADEIAISIIAQMQQIRYGKVQS